jgi:F0F1-type ATP synthase membrane subunit b/b'
MSQTINSLLSIFHLNNELGLLILVGLALVTALYKIMGKVAFVPLLEHVEQRESATVGALFSAGQMRAKADALNVRFQEALLQARVEGNKERLRIIGKAKEEAAAIIAHAEGEAAKTLASARARLASEIAAAHTVVDGEASALAEILAARVDSELSSY